MSYKRHLSIALPCALLLSVPCGTLAQNQAGDAQPKEVETEKKPVPVGDPAKAVALARKVAAGLVDGAEFDPRHAIWSGLIEGGGVREIPVQIYAGNDYGFVLGIDLPSAASRLEVYDARGGLVPVSVKRGEGSVVVEFKSKRSDIYRLRVVADTAIAAALTYVYK